MGLVTEAPQEMAGTPTIILNSHDFSRETLGSGVLLHVALATCFDAVLG
jgi:hypothetical protein